MGHSRILVSCVHLQYPALNRNSQSVGSRVSRGQRNPIRQDHACGMRTWPSGQLCTIDQDVSNKTPRNLQSTLYGDTAARRRDELTLGSRDGFLLEEDLGFTMRPGPEADVAVAMVTDRRRCGIAEAGGGEERMGAAA